MSRYSLQLEAYFLDLDPGRTAQRMGHGSEATQRIYQRSQVRSGESHAA